MSHPEDCAVSSRSRIDVLAKLFFIDIEIDVARKLGVRVFHLAPLCFPADRVLRGLPSRRLLPVAKVFFGDTCRPRLIQVQPATQFIEGGDINVTNAFLDDEAQVLGLADTLDRNKVDISSWFGT